MCVCVRERECVSVCARARACAHKYMCVYSFGSPNHFLSFFGGDQSASRQRFTVQLCGILQLLSGLPPVTDNVKQKQRRLWEPLLQQRKTNTTFSVCELNKGFGGY